MAPDKRSKFVPDSKAYVENKETVEEKKQIYVVPGASETKLVLGGFIQMQYEAGDVFAFEGRFGSAAIDDRFRVRRARINLAGDFADHFDFKIEGEFQQSDVTLTVRNANGQTLASNSTRPLSEPPTSGSTGTRSRVPDQDWQFKAPFGRSSLPRTRNFF